MRKIAIVGSGITGLLTGHGLRKAGYDVTLYSDRTAEHWLNESRPTGTAARFDPTLQYERELGLNHWEDLAPRGAGVHLTFCPTKDNILLTLTGRLRSTYFQAIDVRLQSHRWMADLEARGGHVVIQSVAVEGLDRIAAEHDLTVVATGRAELLPPFRARRRAQRLRRSSAKPCHADGARRADGIRRRAVSSRQVQLLRAHWRGLLGSLLPQGRGPELERALRGQGGRRDGPLRGRPDGRRSARHRQTGHP